MYRLINGDCLNVMTELADRSIDMILTDPPYGITRNSWDTPISFELMWQQYERIIKDNGAIVLFGSGAFTAQLIMSNIKLWRYNLIWQKTTPTGFLNANIMPLRTHEDICVFYKHKPTYNPQKTTGHLRKVSTAEHKRNSRLSTDYNNYKVKSYDSTERYPTSVLTFPTDKQVSPLHATQKPVELLKYLIRTYSNEDDFILDSCMGSGSTVIAALETGRNIIGIEMDKQSFDSADMRIKAYLQ